MFKLISWQQLSCFSTGWWRQQMELFSSLLAFCAENSPVTDEFPTQRPVMRSFDVFFHLRLNQQLSKQWRRRWLETPSRTLWRHCNGLDSCLCRQTGLIDTTSWYSKSTDSYFGLFGCTSPRIFQWKFQLIIIHYGPFLLSYCVTKRLVRV